MTDHAASPSHVESDDRGGSPPTDSTLVVVARRPASSGRPCARPLYRSHISAGFPSPADDYIEASLDLNEHLISEDDATFFVRVAGGSMRDAGIHDGDLLVVDRAEEPTDGDVVIAALDGELTVKRYCCRDGTPQLVPEAEGHDPISIEPGQELRVWGVVQHAVHEVS